jgi:general secretion pathway protein N
LLAGVLAMLIAVALLFWFLPARWVVGIVEPRLQGLSLTDVSGSLWHGRAGRVTTADGQSLGTLDWTLDRDVVLGRTHATFRVDGPTGRFSGRFERTQADRSEWRDVDFSLQAGAFARFPAVSAFAPRGILEGKLPQASLQGNWPLSLAGDVRWRDASVQTEQGRVPLGNLSLRLAGSGGVLRVDLDDDGKGPLAVRGGLDASPLGWRLDLRLHPRIGDTALTQLLARLGPPSADGGTIIRKQAGLVPAGTP